METNEFKLSTSRLSRRRSSSSNVSNRMQIPQPEHSSSSFILLIFFNKKKSNNTTSKFDCLQTTDNNNKKITTKCKSSWFFLKPFNRNIHFIREFSCYWPTAQTYSKSAYWKQNRMSWCERKTRLLGFFFFFHSHSFFALLVLIVKRSWRDKIKIQNRKKKHSNEPFIFAIIFFAKEQKKSNKCKIQRLKHYVTELKCYIHSLNNGI